MAPRFSQEIFDLIIDSIAHARDANEAWPRLNSQVGNDDDEHPLPPATQTTNELRRFALVCRPWHARSIKHLWSHLHLNPKNYIRNAELLRILTTNPSLLRFVRHTDVHITADPDTDLEPCFLSLCVLLAPTRSFRVQDKARMDSQVWYNNPLSKRAIFKFCHSEHITTLYYQGVHFPLGILEHMDNLRDISLADFSGLSEGMLPVDLPRRPFEDFSENLAFKLKRLHVLEASAVLALLLEKSPQIFSGLEEFKVQESITADEYHTKDEISVAKVLSLARNTLRRVHIGRGNLVQLIKDRFNSFDLSLSDLPNLTHLTVYARADLFWNPLAVDPDASNNESEFEMEDAWNTFKSLLERGLPPSLRWLEVILVALPLFEFKHATDIDHPTWQTARKFLAPKRLPALEEVGVRGTWAIQEDVDVDVYQKVANDPVSSAISSMFRHSFPSWPQDSRNLMFWCNFRPVYSHIS